MNRHFAVAMATGFLLTSAAGFAQQTPPPTTPPTNGTATPGNFPGRAGMNQNTGPKPYADVITAKAKTDKGLFTTHKVDDKYYFEIPDSLLGREILVVNRISKAPTGPRAGFLGYAGDQIGENVISFEKGPNNKLFLRSNSFDEAGRDSAGMYNAVRNSNVQPIVASFDIKAFAKDSVTNAKGTVIDVTDYLMGDNDILFFDGSIKRALGLTGFQRETSYVNDVNSYPTNIEIKTVKTYMRTPTPAGGGMTISFGPVAGGAPSTFELNSSMILLPKEPMKPRYFDPRVGFFATSYTDFDANPQGIEKIRMVTRWRLEPKPEDVEKYKRGELVEPARQIVYYIDPATPKKWVPYLIQGVNDWQKAFEKAGFKNAIVAKLAPTNDPSWSLEDARHSAIVYKPSDVPNAQGPHVHDPRSGEILESHINWFHNVMSLVRDWYMIQTAAVDPRARQLQFPDSLMGELIRFVSSHEVGHTLGLRHNFGSSSTVPVENLRNKAWVEANGHTPSIMDYARFNYVAQPEDKISEKGLFPRIGDYDTWAIEWGYKWMPDYKTAQDEVPALNKLTSEKMKNKRLWFGTEVDPDDPRAQNEDLGDNAMKASAYGIKNLQRIVVKLPEWTKEANRDYTSLNQIYTQLTGQFTRYMGHVSKNIGGIQTTPKMQEEGGVVVEFTSKARQKEAMQFLQTQLFTTPTWLVQPKIANLTGANAMTTILGIQNSVLGRLLSNNTFNKMFRAEASGEKNVYTATEMVTDLRKGIWSELASHKAIDIYRRNLQKAYVEQLVGNLKSDGPAITISAGRGFVLPSDYSKTTDAISIAKAQLRILQSEIRAALPAYKDGASRAHLLDVNDRIAQVLDPK
ncbi:zinc-dependent metalloprotease [Flavisolibacter nicotianae]|uniref:zinc-dependent metalloprotease n=1 Tax=Flavisolibacter nicotianae TaxID=2364882 RepID=UPI0019693DFF|nr:zinc-dependent metalloprotease [Flavisolibacter nicotianae]